MRIQVPRRSIAELAVHDQNRIVQMLRPFLDLLRGTRERVDSKVTAILEQRFEQ